MASRRFKQFRYSLETAVTDLYASISIGASGAPTLTVLSPQTNQGIASVTRVSAGKYTIALTDPYVRCMSLHRTSVTSGAAAASGSTVLTADASANAAAPSITITCFNGTTATDPASGEVLLLQITLKNSSIQ